MSAPPLVVMADWSAAATPKPKKPSPDACWLAYGWHGRADRPRPEYFRTRRDIEVRIRRLLVEHPGPALVGVDFSLGYPLDEAGRPLMPSGRALARMMVERLRDGPDGANNRFDIAADLNRRLARRLGGPGPFWGCPPSAAGPALGPTKPASAAPEWRAVERRLRGAGFRPHSVWKLYTTGSVGSQTLLGLAAVGRWLDDPDLGPRVRLWPFDDGFRRPRSARRVIIGEVWPSLLPATSMGDVPAIKDARQVAALRNLAVTQPDPWAALARPRGLSAAEAAAAGQEGWILGFPAPIPPPG